MTLLSSLLFTICITHYNFTHTTMKPIICFLILISALGCANSARILDEMADPQLPIATTVPPGFPQPNNPTDVLPPVVGPPEVPGNPSDVLPPVVGPEATTPPVVVSPPEVPGNPADVLPPVVPPVVATTTPADAPEAVVVPPVVGPIATGPPVVGPGPAEKPALDFFMHDVLGGSQASGRVVTGIVATSDSSNIPFSKANNQVFPVSGGVPLFNNQVNNLVNNNNAPLLAAMNSQQLQQQQQQSNTVIQNAGNANNVINGGTNQPFVTAGQLPQGASLQELMFGSITVIDDEITEGHELGSGVIGSAQGFYLASSLDGESHTMVWTALFHGEHGLDDTISFFGVHRPASPVSFVAVIGGTGQYENAKGYASIESLPQVDQHTTDGVETIVHISVFLS